MDVVGKSNQMLAVPMLSLTLEWAAKLKGNQLGQPLSELLADCCQRLRAHFAQFILDRVSLSQSLQCCPALNLILVADFVGLQKYHNETAFFGVLICIDQS